MKLDLLKITASVLQRPGDSLVKTTNNLSLSPKKIPPMFSDFSHSETCSSFWYSKHQQCSMSENMV